jgi:large subunit ribosomal protein L21
MYAVIRAGGKQYRVAPGDIIRLETQADKDGNVEFGDILAVSGGEGKIGVPESGARVRGEVVEQGRAAKILVFHYKRKKQYKKLRGHRQNYTAVRITEISFDGKKFSAPELPKKIVKTKKDEAEAEAKTGPRLKASAKRASGDSHKSTAHKHVAPKKSAHKKAAPKKKAPSKKK